MKYKVLRSAAHNFAHSFVSMMNYHGTDYVVGHLLRAAIQSGEATLHVDLLTGAAQPDPLLTAPVRDSLGWYVQRFPHHVRSHGAGIQAVEEAEMRLGFDRSRLDRLRETTVPARLSIPFECVVEIVDDRGNSHVGVVNDTWQSERIQPQRV